MSEQNTAFDKFIAELDFQDIAHDTESIKNLYRRAWQACALHYESEIADLNDAKKDYEIEIDHQREMCEGKDSEIAELKAAKVRHDQLVDYLKAGIAEELEQRILDLQAHNNNLREALEEMVDAFKYMQTAFNDWVFDKARKALSATPAESLQSHDNEVIERCAKEVENLRDGMCIAEIIRALKGK